MKSKLLLILLVLITLAGCSGGGGSGSANLEITRGFATGNTNFDGGLYIQGKNTTNGDFFSFALPATQKASLVLSFGVWEITAVGWDNGPVGYAFEGDVLCGVEKVDFRTDNQIFSLQVTKDKCHSEVFGNTTGTYEENHFIESYSPSNPGFELKRLAITTCGALYDPVNPGILRPALNLTSNFCEEYPQGFRIKPKGMKLKMHGKLPGAAMTDGLVSTCLPASEYNITFQTTWRIPPKIPLTVTFFDSPTCGDQEVTGSYFFPQGIMNSNANFFPVGATIPAKADTLFHAYYDGLVLAMASPLSGIGTTPFVTEAPEFSCNFDSYSGKGSPCFTIPYWSGQDYVLGKDRNVIKIMEPVDCNLLSFSGGVNLSQFSCEQANDGTLLEINVSPNLAHNTTGSFSFSSVGKTVTKSYIIKDGLGVMRELMRIVGYKYQSGTLINSLQDDNKGGPGESNGGFMGNVSEILSPALLGGLFTGQPCDHSKITSSTSSFKIYDDGMIRDYQAILTNPDASKLVPGFFANGNPRNTTAANLYNRRLVLREKSFSLGVFETKMVLDFACDADELPSLLAGTTNLRIGRLEEVEVETKSTYTRTEQTLLMWNTTEIHNSRFDQYRLVKEENISPATIKWINTSFTRGEKFPNAINNQSDFKISRLDYEYQTSTSPVKWSEKLSHREIDVSGNLTVEKRLGNLYITKTASVLPQGTIFTDNLYLDEKYKVRYGLDARFNDKGNAMKFSSNGNFIHAYIKNQANDNFAVEFMKGVASYPLNTNLPSPPRLIATDIALDGNQAIVAWVYSDNVIHYAYHDGTNWGAPMTINLTNNVKQISVGVQAGQYIVAAIDINNNFFYELKNVGTPLTGLTESSPYQGVFNYLDFKLVKDTDEFYLFYSVDDDTSVLSHVGWCKVTLGLPDCVNAVLATLNSATTNEFRKLSAYNTPAGDKIYISYQAMDGATAGAIKRAWTNTSTVSWNPSDIASPDFTITNGFGLTEDISQVVVNLSDLSSDPDPTLPPRVAVPYAAPSIPTMKFDYMSLSPSNMAQIFTSPAAFKIIEATP